MRISAGMRVIPGKRVSGGTRIIPGKRASPGQRADRRQWIGEWRFVRHRNLARPGPPHLCQLPPEGSYLDIALGDCLSYPIERLIGRPDAVSPQRGGRTEQRNVSCGRDVGVERRLVGRKFRQLTATA
jgi:hypothetical protein